MTGSERQGAGPEKVESERDHAYFRAIEEAFVRLRGAPLLLSPADWQVAKEWRRRGIPLELAVRVMERIFARQEEDGRDDRQGIKSLRYFKSAVERSWTRVEELDGGASAERVSEPIDVEERLRRLVARLPSPADFAGPKSAILEQALEGLAPAIAGLSGSAPEVEAALGALDEDLTARLANSLDAETKERVAGAVSQSLGRLSARVTTEEGLAAEEMLYKRHLRSEFKLGALSLFAPEARQPTQSE